MVKVLAGAAAEDAPDGRNTYSEYQSPS